MKVQKNQDGLRLNGTRPLLVCADNANLLGEKLNATEKTVKSIVASKDDGLVVITWITKHIFTFHQK
jgi:hypothetical protein